MSLHLDSTRLNQNLVCDLGEYLVNAARAWSDLTNKLVESVQIEKLALEAHEHAKLQSHLADMSAIVLIDVEAARLR